MTRVLVLGGGPDAEREISLQSARAVAHALQANFQVIKHTIDCVDDFDLHTLEGDVIFPAMHGFWGEGGPLQDALEADGRPYVGSGPHAARWCMDKIATKLTALSLDIPTPPSCLFDPRDRIGPIEPPLVLKPTHDGSSVGLHVCRDLETWNNARLRARDDICAHPQRSYMLERFIPGRELTVGLLGDENHLTALPLVEIAPAGGVYDYDAKYARTDTAYTISPKLPPGVAEQITQAALALATHIGVRDLARVDFVLDADNTPWLLEINTMPGFTSTSLLPKAARGIGMSFEDLCARLVELALRRARRTS